MFSILKVFKRNQFENCPFGSTRKYIEALKRKQKSLRHRTEVIYHHNCHTNLRPQQDHEEIRRIDKQLSSLRQELKQNGY